jgi:ABC-type nitrate/sulfonate/bicarbonate transport system permease component
LASLTAPPATRIASSLGRGSAFLFGRRRMALNAIPAAIAAATLFGVWWLYVDLSDIRPTVLPSPDRVFREGWEFRDLLWKNTKPTLQETAIGFSISVVVSTMFAVLIDFSMLVRRALYPILVATQTIPLIVLAPLMIIWFGFGLTPKIILVALITFFPITVGWVDGFASSEREASNLLRSMGANRGQIFRKVRLPSALPSFFSGLRIAIVYSVIGAIFAEYAGARNGLGIFILQQQSAFRTDLVIAAVFVIASVSITLFAFTYVIERIAIPWYFATRRANN